MKKALVFGARGFVGQYTVAELSRRSVEVVSLPSEELRQPDTARLAKLLSELQVDTIFQLAGLTRLRNQGFTAFYDGNVLTTARLAEAMEKAGISVPVYLLGSAAELGETENSPVPESYPCRPHTHYGASKLMQTELAEMLRRRGNSFTVLRLFNVAGPGMSDLQVPLCFLKKIKSGERKIQSLPLGFLRDFVHVSDVARVLCDLAEAKWTGGLINICSGKGVPPREFLRAMASLAEFELEEKNEAAPGNYHNVGDPSLLRLTLGYVPEFSPEECVKEIWNSL